MRDSISLGVIAVSLAILAFTFALEHFLPTLHGRYFPVVTRLEIVAIHESDHPERGQSRIEGRAIKLQDCNYRLIEWFLGSRDGRNAQVTAGFSDPPEIRGAGVQYWTGLYVDLSPSQIRLGSFSDVWHDCGYPWLVRTQFYNPA